MKPNAVKTSSVTRRGFLKTAGAAGAAFAAFPAIIPSRLLGQNAPSKQVSLGIIGCGQITMVGIPHYLKLPNCRITAMCDVRPDRPAGWLTNQIAAAYAEKDGKEKAAPPTVHRDFRELLARPDIDAVYIATPDHWHVAMSLLAIKAGKDLHTEKPLAVSVAELLAFDKAMEGSGRVFTLGTEARARQTARLGVELLWNGLLGKITDIHLAAPAGLVGGDGTPQPVPEGFDYDLWLGPAPEAPYCADRVGRDGIFNIYDYTLGPFSNWGVHAGDLMQWWANLAGIGIPVEYEGTGEMAAGGLYNCPVKWRVTGAYANGIRFHFTDPETSKTVAPEVSRGLFGEIPHHGALVVGENGAVLLNYDTVQARPQELLRQAKEGALERRLPVKNDHYGDWIDCVLSRETPLSNARDAVDCDLIYQLSNIAIRSGKKVVWDPAKKTIANDPALAAMMERPMREPFSLKTLES